MTFDKTNMMETTCFTSRSSDGTINVTQVLELFSRIPADKSLKITIRHAQNL